MNCQHSIFELHLKYRPQSTVRHRPGYIISVPMTIVCHLILFPACIPAYCQDATPWSQPSYPANSKINYVRTWESTAPETNPNTLMTRPLRDVKQTTVYLDGLGRPVESVMKQGSFVTNGNAVDLVTPNYYDDQ